MTWTSGLQLRVIEGKNKGRVVPLEHEQITLGRAANKSERAPKMIFFNEPTVSRIHAVLKWQKKKNKYLIEHKSRTNPTLIDGAPVEKKLLDPGCTIQMGLLVVGLEKADPVAAQREAEARSGRLGKAVQKPKKPPSSVVGPILEALSEVERQRRDPPPQRPMAPEPAAPAPSYGWEPPPRKPSGTSFSVTPSRGETPSDTAYMLVVAEGPDKGANFPLEEMILIIGHREGFDDPRGGQGVLLNDDALPSEQGMLVWQGREGTYGLLQSDSSRVPMAVRRVVSGSPREIPVDRQRPTLLQEGDVILAGRSALVVRRAARPSPTDRVSLADTRPGLMTPRSGQDEWQPAQSPFRSPPTSPQPAPEPTPSPVRSYQPAPIQPDVIPSDDTVGHTVPTDEASPVWARRTAVPGNDTISGRETLGNRSQVAAQNPAAPARRPPASAEPAPSPLSWPWKRTYDYVFDFLAGPNQGCQIALSEGDLPEGRTISIGATGERTNDIIIDSFGVSNRQAMLRYREKRFSLLNEGQSGSVTVNQVPLKSNDHVVLMTGDRIELGDSIFCFLERHTVDVLAQFRLAVESGVANDQDKAFVFSKQRIVVGRGKACEVRLSDLEVSRTHVSIVFRDEQFYIQHRSETNPTFLNGVSLLPGAERKLSPGDRIRLSSLTVLRFVRVDNTQRRKVVQF